MKPVFVEAQKIGRLSIIQRVFREAVNGDQSFAEGALVILMNKLLEKEELKKFELDVLIWFLHNIKSSKQGINIACGADKKRGVGKRGVKARTLAVQVLAHVETNKQEDKKMSMEKIWGIVAKSENSSESAVKKAWMQWKDKVEHDMKPSMDFLRSAGEIK